MKSRQERGFRVRNFARVVAVQSGGDCGVGGSGLLLTVQAELLIMFGKYCRNKVNQSPSFKSTIPTSNYHRFGSWPFRTLYIFFLYHSQQTLSITYFSGNARSTFSSSWLSSGKCSPEQWARRTCLGTL